MVDKSKNPHKDHRSRLRETVRKTGIENMPEHNILELLLFYSIPRIDTNEIAHRLIDRFGSLRRVFDATYEQLLEVDGIGESSALLISSVPGICRKYLDADKSGEIILDEYEKIRAFLTKKYCGCSEETVYMLCLGSAWNLINCCKLGVGGSASVMIDKREALEYVLRNRAERVIFAHNHPNGIAAPSKEDIYLTGDLINLFSEIGIRVSDHIIVADNEVFSMASVPKFKPMFV